MATIDFEETPHGFEAWMMHHGAAKALIGCLVFWVLFGIGIYSAVQYL
ncbi:hypothetical protein FHS83_003758 [Rhizomicrobium palustre]|uniref:Uncharacterized protein n=1 Tax=Rhizomicrobium palustre TaxID=189966 RepID=A0A846N622_9PROT|nr:hypothetical protein [Rhizomicrobium palustre]NIK90440.1 hypothetical protein [Rhizomicrobium palustre]